jgi:hypothetical protein
MGKLRLALNSTKVADGVYGQVDIKFNGVTKETSRQLSGTVETLTYDVEIDGTSNTVGIALLNPQAHDYNDDGLYLDDDNETTAIQVSSLEYSIDGTTYTTLIPQAATDYTVPSGPYAGNVISFTDSVTEFKSYGSDYEIVFNNDGIVTNDYCLGVKGKVLENGNYQDLINNITYDINGNIV